RRRRARRHLFARLHAVRALHRPASLRFRIVAGGRADAAPHRAAPAFTAFERYAVPARGADSADVGQAARGPSRPRRRGRGPAPARRESARTGDNRAPRRRLLEIGTRRGRGAGEGERAVSLNWGKAFDQPARPGGSLIHTGATQMWTTSPSAAAVASYMTSDSVGCG